MMATRDFNQEAGNWDDVPGRVKMAQDISQTIIRSGIITESMNALDYGCGTGLMTLALSPLLHSITGVDSSSEMLKMLQNKIESQPVTNVHTQCLNLEAGDGLEDRFDLIVSSMTLHHIQDVKALLRQFYQLAGPDGILCIADLDADDGQFHKDNLGVFHFGFDRVQMQQYFAEAGFTVVEVQTAAEVSRNGPNGERIFTIFLMIGRKER